MILKVNPWPHVVNVVVWTAAAAVVAYLWHVYVVPGLSNVNETATIASFGHPSPLSPLMSWLFGYAIVPAGLIAIPVMRWARARAEAEESLAVYRDVGDGD